MKDTLVVKISQYYIAQSDSITHDFQNILPAGEELFEFGISVLCIVVKED